MNAKHVNGVIFCPLQNRRMTRVTRSSPQSERTRHEKARILGQEAHESGFRAEGSGTLEGRNTRRGTEFEGLSLLNRNDAVLLASPVWK